MVEPCSPTMLRAISLRTPLGVFTLGAAAQLMLQSFTHPADLQLVQLDSYRSPSPGGRYIQTTASQQVRCDSCRLPSPDAKFRPR
jgi:hypothetical protein